MVQGVGKEAEAGAKEEQATRGRCVQEFPARGLCQAITRWETLNPLLIQVRFQFTCACEREHRKIGTTPSMGSVQLEAVAFDELCSAQADGARV